MDPGIIGMLSEVDGISKSSKKRQLDIQNLYANLQENMDKNLSFETKSFQPDPNQQALADQFDSLMNADLNHTGNMVVPESFAKGPSVVSNIAIHQDQLLNGALTKIDNLNNVTKTQQLSLQQLTSQITEVTSSIAELSLNMGVHMGTHKSLQTSMNTLLKNQ